MRYADSWLYGTVRSPPGLTLSTPILLCACAEYNQGTKRQSKKTKSVCKKCKGTRLACFNDDLKKFSTVRCYSSIPAPMGVTSAKPRSLKLSTTSRPSILPGTDPYNIMRKSRMSLSPDRGASMNKQEKKRRPVDKYSSLGRKSILDCNINPYELIQSSELTISKNYSTIRGEAIDLPKVDYEPVDEVRSTIPKVKNKKTKSTKSNENKINSNRFKSILKKNTTFGDTDLNNCLELSTSPASKSSTNFYFPVSLNVPKKKVQFVEPEGLKNGMQFEYNEIRENVVNCQKDEKYKKKGTFEKHIFLNILYILEIQFYINYL